MNSNELFIEFASAKQRKAFQKWLENGGGFDSYVQFSASKMPLIEQPSCISANELGENGEGGTMQVE